MATKISDLIKEAQINNTALTSFEFFCPKTKEGLDNLRLRIKHLKKTIHVSFISLTCTPKTKDFNRTIELASSIQKECEISVLLHITCRCNIASIREQLNSAKEHGICNILALRGDPPTGSSEWIPIEDGFSYAVDLVKFIKNEYKDQFCIGVAGYPEVHSEIWNSKYLPPSEQVKALDVLYLKQKVTAGADFIITQFCYDSDILKDYIKRVKDNNIDVPIIPGYLPINHYDTFERLTTWTRVKVPLQILNHINLIKNDDDSIRDYGMEISIKICNSFLNLVSPKAIHLFTMNLTKSCVLICQKLGFTLEKVLTPRPIVDKESLFPLPLSTKNNHLSNNDKSSSILFTDEYPNGRWGDKTSPAYGDLSNYYLSNKNINTQYIREMWGKPKTIKDIQNIFVKYINGEITTLPWCDRPLREESEGIKYDLKYLNNNGIWTISSQPKLNGIRSDDVIHGWGSCGGYVYQKCYIEFFISEELFKLFEEKVKKYNNLSYDSYNSKNERKTNLLTNDSICVTWGVFPGSEILQPTMIDQKSFKEWSNDAFEIWKIKYQSLFANNKESESYKIIDEVYGNYRLVILVDNDYYSPNKNTFKIFHELIIDKMNINELKTRCNELEDVCYELRDQLSRINAFYYKSLNESMVGVDGLRNILDSFEHLMNETEQNQNIFNNLLK